MLEALKLSQEKIVGRKQVLKALSKDRVKALFIAKDAESHVTKDLIISATQASVEIIYVNTMKELGQACEIQVGTAVAAILKDF